MYKSTSILQRLQDLKYFIMATEEQSGTPGVSSSNSYFPTISLFCFLKWIKYANVKWIFQGASLQHPMCQINGADFKLLFSPLKVDFYRRVENARQSRDLTVLFTLMRR